jgi:hypothetical protein
MIVSVGEDVHSFTTVLVSVGGAVVWFRGSIVAFIVLRGVGDTVVWFRENTVAFTVIVSVGDGMVLCNTHLIGESCGSL